MSIQSRGVASVVESTTSVVAGVAQAVVRNTPTPAVPDLFHRANEIRTHEGIDRLVEKSVPFLYEQLWPLLPAGEPRVLNGIETGTHKKTPDKFVPTYLTRYVPTDEPEYEYQYVDCVRRYVADGDTVVLIGGGEGVSTVAAANAVGPNGDVTTFEAGHNPVEKTKATVRRNGVEDIVTVTHAIVADTYAVRSNAYDAAVVPPKELPECDVLAIDADGAELPILDALKANPRTLIVEHHAVAGEGQSGVEYQPETVRALLRNSGYEILEEQFDPDRAYGPGERIFVARRQ